MKKRTFLDNLNLADKIHKKEEIISCCRLVMPLPVISLSPIIMPRA